MLKLHSPARCSIAMSCKQTLLQSISRCSCFTSAAYSGTALAFRDRLVVDWNKTQQRQTFADQKRIYCEHACIWDEMDELNEEQIYHSNF